MVDELDGATPTSVCRHNRDRTRRLIGKIPPEEFKERFYAENLHGKSLAEGATIRSSSSS